MGNLSVSRRKNRRCQVGDMRDPIVFFERKIEPPKFGKSQFSQGHIQIGTSPKWCSIMSAEDQKQFDGTGIEESVTHIFESRFDNDFMLADIAKYNGLSYKIKNITNPEGRRERMIFYCELLGDESKQVNR